MVGYAMPRCILARVDVMFRYMFKFKGVHVDD